MLGWELERFESDDLVTRFCLERTEDFIYRPKGYRLRHLASLKLTLDSNLVIEAVGMRVSRRALHHPLLGPPVGELVREFLLSLGLPAGKIPESVADWKGARIGKGEVECRTDEDNVTLRVGARKSFWSFWK